MYRTRPYDEVLRLSERRQVGEGGPDEAVGRVAEVVAVQAGVADGDSFGGEADLAGFCGLVVGGVQVEVGDVPEPACRNVGELMEEDGRLRDSRMSVSRERLLGN